MTRALLFLVAFGATACKVESRDDYLGDKDPRRFELGHTPSAATLATENVDVSPNGAGLPAGSGTPAQGAPIFAAACASCHGANGEGKAPLYPQLIGGPRGAFNFASDPKIPRTIGNYWPYATTLYDYIRRAMPLTAPGSLTADQTYAVTAFLLNREGLVPDGATMDAKNLPAVQMPARSHFVADDRRGSIGGNRVR
ncbi:MAG TPA: c-type cytochrome [Gemmatimonadaceae bacterium]|nr:c-type cytochrome [Gemmatimonadaceae bacterium]